MALGAIQTQGSSGENIVHIGAIRFRVVGSGDLDLSLHSLDDVRSATLPSLAMQATTNREPVRLCNFLEQRTSLTISTDQMNEHFLINRIVVFAKPVYTGYPG